jgi:hypothetical protein
MRGRGVHYIEAAPVFEKLANLKQKRVSGRRSKE